VIGIVSRSDFLEHAGVEVHTGLVAQLRQLLRRVPFSHSDKPEVVGQIMSRPVITAQVDTPVLELVPRMADGLHQIPIVQATASWPG
jgi:CBS domain-containing membrane protein